MGLPACSVQEHFLCICTAVEEVFCIIVRDTWLNDSQSDCMTKHEALTAGAHRATLLFYGLDVSPSEA